MHGLELAAVARIIAMVKAPEDLIVRDGFSREDLTEEGMLSFRAELKEMDGPRFLDQAERNAIRRETLKDWPEGRDLWVFGYGSLMWNPACHVEELAAGRIYGYHRRYCISMPLGRGSPECPGLMLALDNGGSCRGIAFRIAAANIESETEILWRREMSVGTYRAVWCEVHGAQGAFTAITFVINPDFPRYLGHLPHEEIVQRLATAKGRLGTSRDYLYNTVLHLEKLGIHDGPMKRLLLDVDRVAASD